MKQIKALVFLMTITVSITFAQTINWNADTILISTETQLRELASRVNRNRTMSPDGSFSEQVITLANNIEVSNGEWVPIGNSPSNSFDGKFDGNGNVVSGVFINGNNN